MVKYVSMEFSEWLSEQLKSRRLKPSQLAMRSDVSGAEISRLLSGKRRPSLKTIKKIAPVLRTNEGEILRAIGYIPQEKTHAKPESQSPIQRIPIISWVHANKFEDILDPFPAGMADDYTYTEVKGKDIFALKIVNDCMQPKFNPGDIIIINPHEQVNIGDFIVVADREADKATFKQLKKYGTKFYLHPLNPKYDDFEMDHKKQYTIIGKAVKRVQEEEL